MKFSIRDILWLTTLAGVCLGWGLEHCQHQPKPIPRKAKDYEDAPQLAGKTIHDVFAVPSGDIVVRFKDGSACGICDVGLSGPEVMIETDSGTCLLHSWKH